jgi:hypothetical protein
MDEFSEQLGRWLQRGFNVWKDNALTLIFALLLAVSISLCTFLVLAGPMLAGLVAIVLALLDGREPRPQIGDLVKGLRLLGPMFLYVVLILAVSGVGAILSWIPFVGWILAGALWAVFHALTMFTVFFVVDRGMSIVDALRQSTESNVQAFLPALCLFFVTGAIAASGSLVFVVGGLITAPLGVCVLAAAYRDMCPSDEGTEEEPDPGEEPAL